MANLSVKITTIMNFDLKKWKFYKNLKKKHQKFKNLEVIIL